MSGLGDILHSQPNPYFASRQSCLMESKCCYLSPYGCALASKTHCPFMFERTRQAEMFQLHLGLKEHLTVLGTQRNRNESPCRTTHGKCRGMRAGTEQDLEELGSLDLGQPRGFALKMDCVPASPSHRMLDSGDICNSFFLSLFLVTVGASEISIQFENPNIFFNSLEQIPPGYIAHCTNQLLQDKCWHTALIF